MRQSHNIVTSQVLIAILGKFVNKAIREWQAFGVLSDFLAAYPQFRIYNHGLCGWLPCGDRKYLLSVDLSKNIQAIGKFTEISHWPRIRMKCQMSTNILTAVEWTDSTNKDDDMLFNSCNMHLLCGVQTMDKTGSLTDSNIWKNITQLLVLPFTIVLFHNFPLSPDLSLTPLAAFLRFLSSAVPSQLGAAANFDDLVKFGDRLQIRRSQMFIKLAFEFGCDIIFMSHPITRSLGSKLW